MLGAILSMLITILVAVGVGIRLLRLSQRTGEFPEASAGVGLLTFALAQSCSLVMVGGHGSLSPGMSEFLRVLILVAFTVVSAGLAAFTVLTFGPNLWRCALAALTILAGILVRITIYARGLAVVGESGADATLPSLAAATFAFTFLWMGVEGLAYYRKVARAHALGLASAAVVNRFLVFGYGGLIAGVMTTGVAVAGLLSSMDAIGRPLILLAGLVNSVAWTLSFAPPAAYQRFIEMQAQQREANHA